MTLRCFAVGMEGRSWKEHLFWLLTGYLGSGKTVGWLGILIKTQQCGVFHGKSGPSTVSRLKTQA